MRGLTLIEILVSIAILAIVAGLLGSALFSFRESNRLVEAHESALGILRDARARTLAAQDRYVYGVHFEDTTVTLFRGSSYNPADSTNEVYTLPGSMRLRSGTITMPGNVVFQVLSGALSPSTPSGTVIVESRTDASKTKTITIFSNGNIQ